MTSGCPLNVAQGTISKCWQGSTIANIEQETQVLPHADYETCYDRRISILESLLLYSFLQEGRKNGDTRSGDGI